LTTGGECEIRERRGTEVFFRVNLVTLVASFILFAIGYTFLFPVNVTITFSTVPYNYSFSQTPGTSCQVARLPPGFESCAAANVLLTTAFPCFDSTSPPPNARPANVPAGASTYCPKFNPLIPGGMCANVPTDFSTGGIWVYPDGDTEIDFRYVYAAPATSAASCFYRVTAACADIYAGSQSACDVLEKWNRLAPTRSPVDPNGNAGFGMPPFFLQLSWSFNCSNSCPGSRVNTDVNCCAHPNNTNSATWTVSRTNYDPRPLDAFPANFSANVNLNYPDDSFNSLGIGLTSVLSTFALDLPTQPLNPVNNAQSYIDQVRALESTINGLTFDAANSMPSVVNATAYDSHISKQMQACLDAANVMMTCQSAVPESQFDYVIRLFGYTFFITLGAQFVILVAHAVENALYYDEVETAALAAVRHQGNNLKSPLQAPVPLSPLRPNYAYGTSAELPSVAL
jgi:hypothetical protein